MAEQTDRYLLRIPPMEVTRLRVREDGAPVAEAFARLGGVEYSGLGYEQVVAIERAMLGALETLQGLAEGGVEGGVEGAQGRATPPGMAPKG